MQRSIHVAKRAHLPAALDVGVQMDLREDLE
jgi:hypothetical protein